MDNQDDAAVLDPAGPGSPLRSTFDLVPRRPVLVVDADSDSRRLVAKSLADGRMGNPVVEVADGDQAIVELRRRFGLGPGFLPVLVVLDFDLAGTTGLEVVRWMRETPAIDEVPVIILSSDDGAEGVMEAYGLGVRSYLVKPVGYGALSSIVRDLGLSWLLT